MNRMRGGTTFRYEPCKLRYWLFKENFTLQLLQPYMSAFQIPWTMLVEYFYVQHGHHLFDCYVCCCDTVRSILLDDYRCN